MCVCGGRSGRSATSAVRGEAGSGRLEGAGQRERESAGGGLGERFKGEAGGLGGVRGGGGRGGWTRRRRETSLGLGEQLGERGLVIAWRAWVSECPAASIRSTKGGGRGGGPRRRGGRRGRPVGTPAGGGATRRPLTRKEARARKKHTHALEKPAVACGILPRSRGRRRDPSAPDRLGRGSAARGDCRRLRVVADGGGLIAGGGQQSVADRATAPRRRPAVETRRKAEGG